AESRTFLPTEDVAAKFAAQGVTKDKRVVAYCGGGISATIDLFQLHRLGYDNITLYDGSMGEWAKDESLPIETGLTFGSGATSARADSGRLTRYSPATTSSAAAPKASVSVSCMMK